MIGDSGVIIQAENVRIDFSRSGSIPEIVDAGFDESFLGIFIGEAQVTLPQGFPELAPDKLILRNAAIGSGGVSGRLEAPYTFTFDPATRTYAGEGAGDLFGIPFGVSNVLLDFKQNAFRESSISGELLLPFFDKRVAVDIGLSLDGNFATRITGPVEASDSIDPNSGLFTLEKEGLLKLELDSIGFELIDGQFKTKLSGQLTPEFGNLDWPSFEVKELSIDEDGNVQLDGGWLDLDNQASFDLFGFQLEITKLGFGKTEDGGKWIGFSGGIKLVDGLPAGASVEGLRLTWYEDASGDIVDTKLTFNGVGVEFEVPEVLRFKGAVAYNGDINEFRGDIKLELITLEMVVDGQVVFGRQNGDNYMALYLAAELPAGIPLFSTGLSLYGMAGLFALDMEPGKGADQPWYTITGDDWYHQNPVGVTGLAKWRPAAGALAFGAGITVGTTSDNGHAFNGRLMLVIVFPGPVILLEGGANILQERSKLTGGNEPNFRALAVLDKRENTFLFGVDAFYKNDANNGRLIDIRGSAEAYFELDDADNWHLYLGLNEPREKRLRAQIFGGLFRAESYFMLDHDKLDLGAWVGYDKNWDFGPLHVHVEAWIDGSATVSWKPAHFSGELWLHGSAGLSIWRFGTSLTVDAEVGADVFDPFFVYGDFKVGINLPWPLDDIDHTIRLQWGPEPELPPLPLPLQEVAVEHFKTSTSWPLRRGALLLPDYDPDGDGFRSEPAGGDPDEPTDLDTLPVIPLDGRPRLTFSRPIHDDANIGVNGQDVLPIFERIGDPELGEGPLEIRYGLKEIALQKNVAGAWAVVAQSPEVAGTPALYGSWAPVPALPSGDPAPDTDDPVANVKLWLWSKNAFDFSSLTGGLWDEWFTGSHPAYPCLPIPPDREICCHFEGYELGHQLTSAWRCPGYRKLRLSWLHPNRVFVSPASEPVDNLTRGLCFPRDIPGQESINVLTVTLAEPAKKVRLAVLSIEGVRATAFNVDGTPIGQSISGGSLGNPFLEIDGPNIARIEVQMENDACLLAICVTIGLSPEEAARRQELEQHLRDELVRWSDVGEVLEPHTAYRLRIVTTLETKGIKPPPPPESPDEAPDYSTIDLFNRSYLQEEFAYFRTEGPPGLVVLSPPADHPEPADFDSGLDDLVRYIDQTIPATVPAPGEQSPLPRPVFRAYDVGVDFNEDYVDLLYRQVGRDLGLYLFDNNNRPVRDAQGRLIVLSNQWGRTETRSLTASERRWITVINGSNCATLDETLIPHDRVLNAAHPGQTLDADTVYEARLVPLLLHLTGNETLDGWQILNQGSNDAPSAWDILGHKTLRGSAATAAADVITLGGSPDLSALEAGMDLLLLEDDRARATRTYRVLAVNDSAKTVTVDGEPDLVGGSSLWEIPGWQAIVQQSNIWGGSLVGNMVPKPGTMLIWQGTADLPSNHPDRPHNWNDYRLSVFVRSSDNDALGLVFRFFDADNFYRFSMDRQRRYRRLVRVVNGRFTILAEDAFAYREDRDYLITIEAVGRSLRIYQDGQLVFAVADDTIARGTFGLYCWGNAGSRFSDIRVDDFRPTAPIVYRFQFTTSQFANFYHQLHSYQDETWLSNLTTADLSEAELAALLAQAVDPSAAAPADEETRAYEKLAAVMLGPAARQNPVELQVSRLHRDGQPLALLVQSPEPVDWARTELTLSRAEQLLPPPATPGDVKLTAATFGLDHPNEETVSLLLRNNLSLSDHRIEQQRFPGPIVEPTIDPLLFVDDFEGAASGLLFRETFGPNALDHYTIVDQGTNFAPSSWTVSGGHIIQSSEISGGSIDPADPVKPGTMALTGSPDWTDIKVNATLRLEAEGALGVVFRHQASGDHYRFAIDRGRNYRRLTKRVGNVVTILWEDDVAPNLGQSYGLEILAHEDRLLGYLDNTLLFNLVDPDIESGQVGFYSWQNSGAHFEALAVETLVGPPSLWQPDFIDLAGLARVDEPGADLDLSIWRAEDGALVHEWLAGDWLALANGIQGTVHAMVADEQDLYVGGDFAAVGGVPVSNIARWDGTRWTALGSGLDGPVLALALSEEGLYAGGSFAVAGGVPANSIALWDGGQWVAVGTGVTQAGGQAQVRAIAVDKDDLFIGGVFASAGGQQANNVARWDGNDWSALEEGLDGPVNALAVHEGRVVAGGEFVKPDAVSDSFPFPQVANNVAAWDGTRWRSLDRGVNGPVFALAVQDNSLFVGGSFDRAGSSFPFGTQVVANNIARWRGSDWSGLGVGIQGSVQAIGAIGDEVYVGGALSSAGGTPANNIARWTAGNWSTVGEGTDGPVHALQRDAAGLIAGGSFREAGGEVVDNIALTVAVDLLNATRPTTHLIGDASWEDIRLSLELRVEEGGIGGVVFRASAPGEDQEFNAYLFEMNQAAGSRRLLRRVGGSTAVIWQGAGPVNAGQDYQLTIEAVGPQLKATLDGQELFLIQDDQLSEGRIAFWAGLTTRATFGRVTVADATRRIGEWTIRDQTADAAPSVWQLASGNLSQTSAIGGGSEPNFPGTYVFAGDPDWRDVQIRVELQSDADDALGVLFRYVDDDNYYRFSMDAQRSYRRLVKVADGAVQVLWEENQGYAVGVPLVLTIAAVGARLSGYLDEDPLFDIQESTHATGQIGLYTWLNTGLRVERVEVRRPSLVRYALLRDRFTEGDSSEWTRVDEGTAGGGSNWVTFKGTLRQTSNINSPPSDRDSLEKKGTQVLAGDPAWEDTIFSARLRALDDDAVGLLFRYRDQDNYYRFSMDAQRNYRRLVKNVGGSFERLWEDSFAFETGRPYEVVISAVGQELRGYFDGVPMFVVEDADLTAGQIGLYCWANNDARFSAVRVFPPDLAFDGWLFEDTFDFLLLDRWQFVEEGDPATPAEWQLLDGELRQVSNHFGGSTDGTIPDKPGTYALAGDPAWGDYRLSAELRSDDDNALGIMFRYQDADNYYRFSMDSQRSYRRLVKKVAGNVSVLWEDGVPYDVGRPYILTIDCVGTNLTAYLDGIRLFSLEDGDLSRGQIGLYSWANAGARFAAVRLAAPFWAPYYTFGQEERLPAGTLVKVHAGSEADGPTEEPGHRQRFVATAGDRGRVQFLPEGANLRVRAQGGASGHRRRFLPSGEYATVDSKVIRKADGTGFFLLVPEASGEIRQLPLSQYRLTLTYRRDNRAVDANSLVLRQAGSTTPEEVSIDIPWQLQPTETPV